MTTMDQIYIHRSSRSDRFFQIELVVCLVAFAVIGNYLRSVVIPPKVIDEKKIEMMKTKFVIEEKKKPRPPKPVQHAEKKPVTEKPAEVQQPVDLTKNPVLNQQTDDIVKQDQKTMLSTGPKVVRRVYGLRRVFSTGLGAGGSMSDAVIGKLGNTLNKPVDTLTAKPEDLKGQLVSVTTVTTMPKLLKSVKAEYTSDMIKNKVEGDMKAELLIDVDGSVKEVKIENDLGFGSREIAITALKQHKFSPAMRGKEPVAVWILYTYSFRLLEG